MRGRRRSRGRSRGGGGGRGRCSPQAPSWHHLGSHEEGDARGYSGVCPGREPPGWAVSWEGAGSHEGTVRGRGLHAAAPGSALRLRGHGDRRCQQWATKGWLGRAALLSWQLEAAEGPLPEARPPASHTAPCHTVPQGRDLPTLARVVPERFASPPCAEQHWLWAQRAPGTRGCRDTTVAGADLPAPRQARGTGTAGPQTWHQRAPEQPPQPASACPTCGSGSISSSGEKHLLPINGLINSPQRPLNYSSRATEKTITALTSALALPMQQPAWGQGWRQARHSQGQLGTAPGTEPQLPVPRQPQLCPPRRIRPTELWERAAKAAETPSPELTVRSQGVPSDRGDLAGPRTAPRRRVPRL